MQKKMKKEWKVGDKIYYLDHNFRIKEGEIWLINKHYCVRDMKTDVTYTLLHIFSSPKEILEKIQSQIPKLK